jgi:hypothetical protein
VRAATATANIGTALTATQPGLPDLPTSSTKRNTASALQPVSSYP